MKSKDTGERGRISKTGTSATDLPREGRLGRSTVTVENTTAVFVLS